MNKFPEFKYEGISYIAPDWKDMGDICFALALKILESKKKYDRVVALAKGGWTWARALVDYLNIENIASVQIKFYSGVESTTDKPVILQSLSTSVNKENILLFDDVADSGKTLKIAREYILKCGASKVDTATLFYKPRSIIKPKYFIYTTSAWVIFPHEIHEIVKLAGLSWLKKGLNKKEVLNRFEAMKLPKDQIEYFLKLYNA